MKLDPKNDETRQLRALAQSHVDEKIKQARAKELAPETGNVNLPVPADAPPPVTPDAQPPVAVRVPVGRPLRNSRRHQSCRRRRAAAATRIGAEGRQGGRAA